MDGCCCCVSDLNPLMEGDEKSDDGEELLGGRSGKPTSDKETYVHTEVKPLPSRHFIRIAQLTRVFLT